jgi:hypothetical protein
MRNHDPIFFPSSEVKPGKLIPFYLLKLTIAIYSLHLNTDTNYSCYLSCK